MFALLACCLLAAVRADAEIASPFLWRLTTPGCADSWLFGSIHLPSRTLWPLPEAVSRAFGESDAVICEIPFDDKSIQKIEKGSRGASEPLARRLPPDLYSRCERYLQSLSPGFPLSSLDQMQLWSFSFTVLLFGEEIRNPGVLPLDCHFFKQGAGSGKKTGGLETVEEQLESMRSFSEKEILEALRASLDDMEALRKKGEKPFDRLLAAYCSGDGKKLQEEAERSVSGYSSDLRSRYERILLDERNPRMAERIRKRILASPETSHFFVIGALHCLGEGSVVARLPAAGTSVRRQDR